MKKLNAIKFNIEFNLLNIRKETIESRWKSAPKFRFLVDLKIKNMITLKHSIVKKDIEIHANNKKQLLERILRFLDEKILLEIN